MIDKGSFVDLATKIVKDRASLERIYQGQSQDEVCMRRSIGLVEKECSKRSVIVANAKRRDGLQRPIEPPPTPFLNFVREAACRLGWDEILVRYQILQYAERNNFYHSHLVSMIDQGSFMELAEKIVKDKASLELIYQGRLNDQVHMRTTIGLVQKEWFKALGSRGHDAVTFVPADKAVQKMKALGLVSSE